MVPAIPSESEAKMTTIVGPRIVKIIIKVWIVVSYGNRDMAGVRPVVIIKVWVIKRIVIPGPVGIRTIVAIVVMVLNSSFNIVLIIVGVGFIVIITILYIFFLAFVILIICIILIGIGLFLFSLIPVTFMVTAVLFCVTFTSRLLCLGFGQLRVTARQQKRR